MSFWSKLFGLKEERARETSTGNSDAEIKPKLIAIGYWKSIYEPNLPDPARFKDSNWNIKERKLVQEYLMKGISIADYMGFISYVLMSRALLKEL
jgi:hypothetical protein